MEGIYIYIEESPKVVKSNFCLWIFEGVLFTVLDWCGTLLEQKESWILSDLINIVLEIKDFKFSDVSLKSNFLFLSLKNSPVNLSLDGNSYPLALIL